MCARIAQHLSQIESSPSLTFHPSVSRLYAMCFRRPSALTRNNHKLHIIAYNCVHNCENQPSFEPQTVKHATTSQLCLYVYICHTARYCPRAHIVLYYGKRHKTGLPGAQFIACVAVSAHQDHSFLEVNSIQHWAVRNRIKLNLTKTWEMVVHGIIPKPLPPLVQGIERKSWLKLLGIIFQENPSDWDLQVGNLLRKASSRLYILRVCKYFGYPKEQLTKLFDLLIMSLFLYGIEVWGAAYQGKYLDRIDKFFKRAFRFGYTNNLYVMAEVIRNRDCKLWNTITDTPCHPLYQLLPPKKQRFLRNRGHDFILPAVKTERFKRSFINRCL